jgi:hypothetical protein
MTHRTLAFTLFLISFTSRADDIGWKVGLASANVTPTEPVMLAGYASRSEPFTGVLDDLHMKALAIEDASGTRALIITADLIGFTAEVGDPIRERIASATKIPRENVLLNASHTHAGPALALQQRERSVVKEDHAEKTIAYTKRVQDICVKLAQDALAALKPARLSVGGGVVHFPMNRREISNIGVNRQPPRPASRTMRLSPTTHAQTLSALSP